MRIAFIGKYGIYEPFDSCDGRTGWTVQRFEFGDDPEQMGDIVGEFAEQSDAALFAQAKARDDASKGAR